MTVLTRRGLSAAEADRSFQAGKGFATLASVDAAFPNASERERRQIADEFNTVFVAAGSTEIEGASKVLATLAAAGHRLYLSTGAEPEVLEAALDRHGWGDVFDLALGSSADLPKGIGHLERFATTSGSSLLAEWARTTLTVGDGPGEMGFGAQAGIAFRCAFVSEENDDDVSLLRDAGANLRIRELREVAEVAAHSDPLSVARWSI
jgi:phosphoglycolate phosphatase-like HAD superfamily hydrolase